MKKTLSKLSLQELAEKMPRIDENTQESCVGGNYYFNIETGLYMGQDWFGPMANGSGVYLLSQLDYYQNVLLSGSNGMSSNVFFASGEYIANAPLYPEEVLHKVLEYYMNQCGVDIDFSVNIVSTSYNLDWNSTLDNTINVPITTIFEEDLINLFLNHP